MNAKQCDRCGSYYGLRYLSAIEEWAKAVNVLPYSEELRIKIEENIDLCPKCSAQLAKWLKEGDFVEE